MRIWKYTLAVTDRQSLSMPDGAHVLSVQVQGGMPQLWALVDEKAPQSLRHFDLYGTGNPVPSCPKKFIGTFQLHGGGLVFHLFEVAP